MTNDDMAHDHDVCYLTTMTLLTDHLKVRYVTVCHLTFKILNGIHENGYMLLYNIFNDIRMMRMYAMQCCQLNNE